MQRVAWGLALGALLAACSNGTTECHAPQYRDERGRCVVDCADLPGAVCDPDSGQVVGYRDAASEGGEADGGGSDAASDGAGAMDAMDAIDATDAARDASDGGDAVESGGCAGDASAVCDAGCVDLASDPSNCGRCGIVCAGATNAQATCAGGQCGIACDPGYERMGAGCDVAVPRLVAPMSTSRVTSQTPTLRWELTAGLDGATVEVCPDRMFQSPQCQTFDAAGSSGHVATALTRGVWFWRAHGRARGAIGARTSAVWEMFVGARSAGDTSCGSTLDVNGDGLGDLAVGTGPAMASGIVPAVYLYPGTSSGPAFSAAQTVPAPDASRGVSYPSNAGDVNGDGFGDLVVHAPLDDAGTDGVFVLMGSAQGLVASPISMLSSPMGFGGGAAGDFNGDGYGDVAFATSTADDAGAIVIFAGGPMGLSTSPFVTLNGSLPGAELGEALATAGDVDGDGLVDVIAGERYGGDQSQGDVVLFRHVGGTFEPTASVTINGNADTLSFGSHVAGAGDIDGDGLCDVALGDPNTNSRGGTIYVYRGDAQRGLSIRSIAVPNPGGATAQFGRAVSSGDVNGDGFDDLVGSELQGVHIYLGRVGGLDLANAITLIDPQTPAPSFGDSLAGGDSDGDGRADVVVGEPFRATNTGRILYFRGGPSGSTTNPTTVDGTMAGARFGQLLAL